MIFHMAHLEARHRSRDRAGIRSKAGADCRAIRCTINAERAMTMLEGRAKGPTVATSKSMVRCKPR
jgi:hypothetical protein